MRIQVRSAIAAAAFGAVLALPAAASADNQDARGSALARAASGAMPGETYTQWRRRGGIGAGGVAAGVIGGLAAGALIGGLAAQAGPGPGYYGPPGPGVPVGNVYGADPNWVSYCASKYRSFDPVSGTYLARDGYRYPCQ